MTDKRARWHQVFDRLRREEAAQLAAEKRDAVWRGKEPFDLDKFDEYLHPPDYHTDRAEQFADYEYQYYVVHRGVLSIREFADLLLRLDIDKDK